MSIAFGTTDTGGDSALLDRLLPLVSLIETTPDNLGRVRDGRVILAEHRIEEVREVSRRVKVVAHGVGLSIASHDTMNEDYLRLLDALFERIDFAWHSEHLGYTHVDGRDMGTMLVPPHIEEAVELVARRAETIRRRYGVPFLLENVVSLLPAQERADYTPAGFLNEIARRSGCGLILDVYNLECDARNLGLDIDTFLAELDFDHVRELHIANGVERSGLMLDVHSRPTRPETRALADRVIAQATKAEVILFELLEEALPVLGHQTVVDEVTMLRGRFAA
jgi:uncharacterized protein (UPF0276 family)